MFWEWLGALALFGWGCGIIWVLLWLKDKVVAMLKHD